MGIIWPGVWCWDRLPDKWPEPLVNTSRANVMGRVFTDTARRGTATTTTKGADAGCVARLDHRLAVNRGGSEAPGIKSHLRQRLEREVLRNAWSQGRERTLAGDHGSQFGAFDVASVIASFADKLLCRCKLATSNIH